MAARVSLGDVAASILDASLPDGPPILARRRGPERRLAEAKAEEREQSAVARAKRALAEQPHQSLRAAGAAASDPVLETKLRKIATRGVVQLFNAVRAAQKDETEGEGEGKKAKRPRKEQPPARPGAADEASSGAPADLSRDSFLDLLRRGSGPAAKPSGRTAEARAASGGGGEGAMGASFLRDDFMLGRNRAKDWAREEEEEEEDEGFVDDAAHGADDEEDD